MKNLILFILVFISLNASACGGRALESFFYNLFFQTNISAKDFYPFLRDEDHAFFGEDICGKKEENIYPQGNVKLWKAVLVNWNTADIVNAVYKNKDFDWSEKKSKIEKRAKIYINFAQECSYAFNYRYSKYSWDYEEILKQQHVDAKGLLSKANLLLAGETNPQLRTRYYYQIIRILHYSKNWQEAIRLYESKLENKIPKDEIYYYIADQIGGCYYSTKNYNKAAYLFAKVVNNSIDRKESAFTSFKFCAENNAEGKSYFVGVEDEKDLLLMQSLRDFSNEVDNINKFIRLAADDARVELLFMRALNEEEEADWPKANVADNDRSLPYYGEGSHYKELLTIANQQIANSKVKNKDFWRIASSYLSFMAKDVTTAKRKLKKVNSYPEQKKILSTAYEVFSWDSITPKNENFIVEVLRLKHNIYGNMDDSQNDLRDFILDIIAHKYYKNGHLAKAFLVHNYLEVINEINSLELLNALEKFYNKPHKSNYEKMLIKRFVIAKNFMDYVNYQKGIYYLYHDKPEMALSFFIKNKSYRGERRIPASVFSNNIMECFQCSAEKVMTDKVYQAKIFAFIKTDFTRKELAENLVELKKLTHNSKQWKAKLANYLLGNFYFNISNTGYYRGLLTDDTNVGDYIYIHYANDNYSSNITGEEIIEDKSGYNLYGVGYHEKHHFFLSDKAKKYYQKVIDLSKDKELNARCLYMMAKCDLNDFYNNGTDDFFYISTDNNQKIKLPNSLSYELLKMEYSDTKFHDMIIKECSYFRSY